MIQQMIDQWQAKAKTARLFRMLPKRLIALRVRGSPTNRCGDQQAKILHNIHYAKLHVPLIGGACGIRLTVSVSNASPSD